MNNPSLAVLVGVQIVQVTLCIAAAALLSFGCLRRRPALAAAVWLAVLCKCATPPVWASPLGVFSWLQAEKPRTPTQLPSWVATASPTPRPESVPPEESSNVNEVASTPTIKWSSFWPWMLAIVWAAGFLWTFSRAFRQRRRWLAAVVEDCEPPESVVRAVAERSQKLGMKTPRIVMVAADAGPAASGWFRPTVYLPTGVDPKQLESMLVHELVHLRRRDPWLGALQAFVSSAYWFHPGVRWASDELSRCIEEACDAETVRELGCKPVEYAAALVALLERRVAPTSVPMVAGMSPARSVKRRLEAVMKTNSHRRGRTARGPWLAFAVAALIALPGAGLPPEPPKKEVQFVPNGPILPNPVATPVKDPPMPPIEIKNFSHRGYDLKPAVDVLVKRCGLREDAACNAVANLAIAAAEHIGPRPVFAIANQRLFAFAAEAQHEWMQNVIESTVQDWAVDQIVIETEIWDVPKSALEGFKFDVHNEKNGEAVAFLSEAGYKELSKRLLADKTASKIAAPRLTTLDGQNAIIKIGAECAHPLDGKYGKSLVGIGIEMEPKCSADGKQVSLKVRYEQSQIAEFESRLETKALQPFKVPVVNSSTLEMRVSVGWGVRVAVRMQLPKLLVFKCTKAPRTTMSFNIDPPGDGRLQANADPRMTRALELLKRRAKVQEARVRVYPMGHHLRKDGGERKMQLESLTDAFQQLFDPSTLRINRDQVTFKPSPPNETIVVNAPPDVHEFFSRMLRDIDRRTEEEQNSFRIPPEIIGHILSGTDAARP
jgi:beta-lactamase regulating signal transducer with metallopeptidase domain